MNTEEITELTNTIIAAEKRGWNEALDAVKSILIDTIKLTEDTPDRIIFQINTLKK